MAQDTTSTVATSAGLATLGPVGWALAAANLATGIFGGMSARKQRKKLKAELERRRLALIDSKNMAIGRIAEGTAAAKSPLEAIAERVRTEEGFKDPVLEQSLVAGTRQQLGAQLRQTQAGQTSASQGIPQQQLMMAALLSQVQSSSLSRQLARRQESTRALAGIYGQLSEITQAGAQSAAGIETQFASMAQNEPIFNQEGNDVLASGLGGLMSFLNTDTGKQGLAELFAKASGDDPAGIPSVSDGSGWVTDKIRPWWEGMLSWQQPVIQK